MRHLERWLWVACATLLIAACGSDKKSPDDDTEGDDGGIDAGDDAGEDAGMPMGDVAPHGYMANDPNLQYSGRIDFSDPLRPTFSAPGVYITARFKGVSVAVMLEDEIKWGNTRNYYDVVIDGTTTIEIEPDWKKEINYYSVISNLPYGEHEVTLIKRTQALMGRGIFLGFELGGEILAPASKPTRKIQIIGNSVSAGEGIDGVNGSDVCSADTWGQPTHNAGLAFGPVLARTLDAEYHLIGISGVGMLQNWNTGPGVDTMPEVYDLTFTERSNSPDWDHTQFVPDAVIIELGTNDYSVGESTSDDYPRPAPTPEEFSARYIQFLETLFGYFPSTEVFAISSPLLSDGYPESTDTRASDIVTGINLVAQHFTALGNTQVHPVEVSKANGNACSGHPDAEGQAGIAAEVEVSVRAVMGW